MCAAIWALQREHNAFVFIIVVNPYLLDINTEGLSDLIDKLLQKHIFFIWLIDTGHIKRYLQTLM